ncbi:MAG: PQQ-binding-like beta-propeller repeat protein [Gammaproteobacteria bacterium]|nr:PQQ-binding-like beta-propeller repeat protein [Gammaproteobacteria bacterium]MDH5303533.1 PQQ-binding-like beta-propeller repeat protein [Gammaproteobacteria bacterium]MDH5321875.1 PQQ-binding-like beta-propeller repeat protein [Gammaproteobacteria bacterium]
MSTDMHMPKLAYLLAALAAAAVNSAGAQDVNVLLPDAEGKEIVTSTCGNCHSLGLVIATGRSADDWSQTIDRMRGLGAYIAGDDGTTIQRYLAEHFPPRQDPMDFATVMAGTPVGGEPKYARPNGASQWPGYGGGPLNQNFSPLTQINPDNVGGLELAWAYRYGTGEHDMGDQGIDYRFEVTPLLIGDVMYFSTPASPAAAGVRATITALKPETGELVWKFESPYNIHGRGIAYWPGDQETAPRIIFATAGGYIMAVDVTTGALAPGFGRDGVIDAYVGVASEIVGESRRDQYTVPNPVTIFGDLFIAGARPGEAGPPGPRGDVRAFSARDGRLAWTFHTAPQPGEPHADLVPDPAENYDVTGANVWTTMTLDPVNGIVYAPLGDLNARNRGPELFSGSIVALKATTGELMWYQQITHKDMWDWDAPTPAVLMDLERDGNAVPALLLTGKHGLVFLFNRLTGESLNGLEERPTPRSNIPGVEPWPSQPFPAAPEPVARNSMTRDEIPDMVPGMKEHCQAIWDEYKPLTPGLYALPLSDRAVVSGPGATGGPNWGGGSYNSAMGYFFINTQNQLRFSLPTTSPGEFVTRSRIPDNARPLDAAPGAMAQPTRGSGGGQRFSFSFDYEGDRLPCVAGPWGELVAVDVRKLEIAWRVPLGFREDLGDIARNMGTRNLGGNLATASGLVFIAATNDRRFRAFDARNGDVLWEAELPAGGHATPISYQGSDGRQYVVIAAGGGTSIGRAPEAPRMSDSVVAFRLPD